MKKFNLKEKTTDTDKNVCRRGSTSRIEKELLIMENWLRKSYYQYQGGDTQKHDANERRHKGPHIVQLHFYEMSRKGKPRGRK